MMTSAVILHSGYRKKPRHLWNCLNPVQWTERSPLQHLTTVYILYICCIVTVCMHYCYSVCSSCQIIYIHTQVLGDRLSHVFRCWSSLEFADMKFCKISTGVPTFNTFGTIYTKAKRHCWFYYFKGRINWKIVQALVEVLQRMHKKRWMGKCTEKVVKSD